MTSRYSNNSNLSLYAQVYLATDWYDTEEAGLSVTTLIKPIRQTVLARRVAPGAMIADLVDEVASRNGSAIHDGFERAWKNDAKRHEAMDKLGIPKGLSRKIIVNPTPEQEAAGGAIFCYTEIRSSMVIAGVKVTGKFDFIGDGTVEDLKNTGVYKYMMTDGRDYVLQGSMYRLLNQDKVKKDWMNLTFNFSDWSKRDQRMKPDKYPPAKMLTKRYNLMSVEDTLAWAEGRIEQLLRFMNAPEADLPLCTKEELWQTDPAYKYYSDPAKANVPGTRSSKNFDNMHDAQLYLNKKGKGIIITVPAEVKACLYCPAFAACTQKDALIASGALVLR